MVTTYFINCIAGNVFQTQTSPALPTSYYLGLSTTTPTIAGGNVTEPSSAANYARVKLTLSAPSSGVVANSAAVSFPISTASWGKPTYFVLYDAAEGGNLLMAQAITLKRTISSGIALSVKKGLVKLQITNPS